MEKSIASNMRACCFPLPTLGQLDQGEQVQRVASVQAGGFQARFGHGRHQRACALHISQPQVVHGAVVLDVGQGRLIIDVDQERQALLDKVERSLIVAIVFGHDG